MGKILLTGAAGRVAGMVRPLLRGHVDWLVLSDRVMPADLHPQERFALAELGDLPALEGLCEGVEAIVHLGGCASERPWQSILESNIAGVYNLYEAARRRGVQRLVFASSNHAVGFYPRAWRIGTQEPVRPDTLYGASKAFGEALGSLYADKHGLRVLNIRIGHVGARPADHRDLAIWIHPQDLVQLIRIGLEHPQLHCEIVYGVSDNERGWWDNRTAFRLGYRPAHRAESYRAQAAGRQGAKAPDPVGDRFQGGSYCAEGFDGDLDRSQR